MTFQSTLDKALSVGKADLSTFKELYSVGIKKIELSTNRETYFDKWDFPNKAEDIASAAAEAGIEIWSIHLPFSQVIDISNPDEMMRRRTIDENKLLIKAAGRIGIKAAVLHPSSEPIAEDQRENRMALSHEAITELAEVAKENGVMLAVENLPRTCLCRTADEMIKLLDGTGAYVVFDTNHCLIQNNYYYINALTDAGVKIVSLHVSDYDFINERHVLPGLGYNNWDAIFEALERAGYNGPMLYETNQQSFAEAAENMEKLQAGFFSKGIVGKR